MSEAVEMVAGVLAAHRVTGVEIRKENDVAVFVLAALGLAS